MVAERAGLRRAAARPRDGVPPVGGRLPGLAGARVDVHNRAPGEPCQIDRTAIGRRQGEIRKPATREMTRGAVVLGRRQVGRQYKRIVRHSHGLTSRQRTHPHRTPARGRGPANYGAGESEMNSISDPSGSRK